MNHLGITKVLIGGTLLGAALSAVADGPATLTGSLSYTREEGAPPGIESLDIQVTLNDDGTVTGEAHNSLRDGNFIVWQSHLRIDCLHFLDDHTVLVGGVDVWDYDPGYVGSRVAFVVRDNGEGKNAARDQRTTVYYSLDVGMPLLCEGVLGAIERGLWDYELDFRSADTGNIQVRP